MPFVSVSSLFEVRYGHSLELNRLEKLSQKDGGIPFISRKMRNNGIATYVRPIGGLEPAPAGDLTCALSGNGVLSTFLQEQPFYTAFHVACLRPKLPMTTAELLYYCTCIRANRYRYSYGRQANRTLRDLLVPAQESFPAWVTDADVKAYGGADRPQEPFVSLVDHRTPRWETFKITDLFDTKKGKRVTKAQLKERPGGYSFIGAIDSNNGVTGCIDQAVHDGGTLTVNYNGAGVADTFYQPEPFWASDDVNVLYPKFKMSPEIGLFLATVVKKEKYRFNYGRKWHLERMKTGEIHLPVDSDGRPDWKFMEKFIRSLPFSSSI